MKYIKVQIEPLSLNQLQKKYPKIFWGQEWFKNEKFAKSKPRKETLYIGTDIVEGSLSKTYSEQEKLLDKGSFVPTANQLAQMAIEYHKQNKQLLTNNYYFRTSDVTAGDGRVRVVFPSGGFNVGRWSDFAVNGIGVAASRKSLKLEAGTLASFDPLKSDLEITEIVLRDGRKFRLVEKTE